MILTRKEIQKQVELGRITIEPFAVESLNPNSYNYHLGKELIIFPPGEIVRGTEAFERIHIPPAGIVLQPDTLYLGQTVEEIGSDYYASSLIGRSTMGRLGLWLQVTADLGHVGTAQCWTLEMKVVQPLRVFAGMPIGQVTFWHCFGDIRYLYIGKYAHDYRPETSKL